MLAEPPFLVRGPEPAKPFPRQVEVLHADQIFFAVGLLGEVPAPSTPTNVTEGLFISRREFSTHGGHRVSDEDLIPRHAGPFVVFEPGAHVTKRDARDPSVLQLLDHPAVNEDMGIRRPDGAILADLAQGVTIDVDVSCL